MKKTIKTTMIFALMAIFGGMIPSEIFAQQNRLAGKRSGKYHKGHYPEKVGKNVKSTQIAVLLKEKWVAKKLLTRNGPTGDDNSLQPISIDALQIKDSDMSVREDENVKSGSFVVNVTSNGNASVIKLGMSAMGVTMIEFPANDPIYEIHRNDLYSDFVTVSCRRQEAAGRCLDNPADALILRPGKDFRATGGSLENSTVITVQRISGMVVSFVIVPVASIAQNANHVVIAYPVDQIVESRRLAGLAVNLAPPPPMVDKSLAQTSPLGENDSPTNVLPSSTSENNSTSAITETPQEALEKMTTEELHRVGNSNIPLRFAKAVHGLSVAVAPNNTRLAGRTVDVFAVRNTLKVPIRLVPEMPELYVETLSGRGGKVAVSSTRIPILYVATTADGDNILQPGETYFFSIAYEVPILGAKQTLRVGFAQTNAADEPSAIELSGLAR